MAWEKGPGETKLFDEVRTCSKADMYLMCRRGHWDGCIAFEIDSVARLRRELRQNGYDTE